MQAQQLRISAVCHYAAGGTPAVVQTNVHPKLRPDHIRLRRHLLQKLTQINGVQLRFCFLVQKFQQSDCLAEGAVQLHGSGVDIRHCLPGRRVCTGAVKMLLQIFTVAPDQRQRTEADLLDPLLLLCGDRPHFCPLLLHCSASPGDAIFSTEHRSVPTAATVCKPYGRVGGAALDFCRSTTSLTA